MKFVTAFAVAALLAGTSAMANETPKTVEHPTEHPAGVTTPEHTEVAKSMTKKEATAKCKEEHHGIKGKELHECIQHKVSGK